MWSQRGRQGEKSGETWWVTTDKEEGKRVKEWVTASRGIVVGDREERAEEVV